MRSVFVDIVRLVCLVAVVTVARAESPGLPVMPSLSPLLAGVKPAVVNISVPSAEFSGVSPLREDPFFKRFLEPLEKAPAPAPYVGVGSGVIVDAAQGYLLTNHHVIEGIDDIVVTLEDQRRFRAELIGSDAETDVALLRIRADGLKALAFGNSDRLDVGDFVLAIGNPFGLGQTVTSGIVSGLGRSGLGIEGYEDFIQTDATINPGNSGGALVDLTGALVGINTAILAAEGGNVGISFAIPSNMARAVMEQLLRYGEMRRGRIGVALQDLTPELGAALDIEGIASGAVLAQVVVDSPAGKAGLRLGDVVVAMNGRPVRSSADLRNQIGLVRIGSQVELTLLRDGATRTQPIRIVAAEALPPGHNAGMSLDRLEGAILENTQPCAPIFGNLAGVLVLEVEEGSAAALYGLQQGDIIVAVKREPVDSVAALDQALAALENRPAALNVIRENSGLFIVLEPSDEE